MTDNETNETTATATTEGTPDVMLDLFLANWPRIAATAWEGFAAGGRGAVTVVSGSVPPALSYHVGPPCPCHEELVSGYYPECEVVVAVIDDDGDVVWIATLGGWPTPEETSGTTTADLVGAILH
jgi:hypothetical protein